MKLAANILAIDSLRQADPVIVSLGNHQGIIQSMLDYDYLLGRSIPSVKAIVAGGRRTTRFFFGHQEIALPMYPSVADLPPALRQSTNLVLNVGSGRRVVESTAAALAELPNLAGVTVFGEGVPERHALQLVQQATDRGVWVLGAASVGLIIPGTLKLGAIGGTQAAQLVASRLTEPGTVAVLSTSGGMINELIRLVATTGHTLSWAAAIGGERFPMLPPKAALLAAQADPATRSIVFFGELGGHDEYDLAALITSGQLTKPVVAYIAGSVAELFDTPPQFGHAKAIAKTHDESAKAKAAALRAAGVQVGETYAEFAAFVQSLPDTSTAPTSQINHSQLTNRRPALIASTVSRDRAGQVDILGTPQLELAQQRTFAAIVAAMLLGRPNVSLKLEAFVDLVLKLLVDNGPYVSGALNTITAARAGKDLVSALSAGLLTIGPRFGGAINQAAATWLAGVVDATTPAKLVESAAASRQRLAGIGHRKYRIDMPDPRVEPILQHALNLTNHPYTDFALAVQTLTTSKKGNLILNVDGAMAAVLLDLLATEEKLDAAELQSLIDTEFFNALFVLSRSVGFMSHYFDQRRLDEGLLRLSPADVAELEILDSSIE